jgi:diacylglycerol O-acyltransferase / wax synthase
MSYRGRLAFGIVADRDQVPDIWMLVEWLAEALQELRSGVRPAEQENVAGGRENA